MYRRKHGRLVECDAVEFVHERKASNRRTEWFLTDKGRTYLDQMGEER